MDELAIRTSGLIEYTSVIDVYLDRVVIAIINLLHSTDSSVT